MKRRAVFLVHGLSDEWFWGIWRLTRDPRDGKVSLFDSDRLFGPEKLFDSVDETFLHAKKQLAAIGSDIEKLPVYCEGYYVSVLHQCRIEEGRLVLPKDLWANEEEER